MDLSHRSHFRGAAGDMAAAGIQSGAREVQRLSLPGAGEAADVVLEFKSSPALWSARHRSIRSFHDGASILMEGLMAGGSIDALRPTVLASVPALFGGITHSLLTALSTGFVENARLAFERWNLSGVARLIAELANVPCTSQKYQSLEVACAEATLTGLSSGVLCRTFAPALQYD